MTTVEILKEYWGHDHFRPTQEDIINSILEGKDVLALLPTGGGKSVCFQVPALAKEGICLVISPLIALMKDQVQNLHNKGINALSIYSGMSFLEIKKTLQNAAHGNFKFLYVSPERLETDLFLDYLPAMNINLIAVDEAHCISQWGYDFRPSYLKIAQLRSYVPNVPVLALTASATKEVQDDICSKLLFAEGHKRFQQSFSRPNLSYSVFAPSSKQQKMLEILNKVPGSAIVYCRNRKHTKDVADLLHMHGIKADFYHAGLTNEERNRRQDEWIKNKIRVIACTNAFGMGIDKPDVRVVIHYDVPDCLENYYQEAGRAGRDGKRSYAVLLYNSRELTDLEAQVDLRYPALPEIKKVYTALMNHLQIAAGGGEGTGYNFDITAFADHFALNILSATYVIKALEQEGFLYYNETFFKPSTLVFNCTKEELSEFERSYPAYEELLKGLLRSYEGIFDFPASVYESSLARFTGFSLDLIKKQLLEVHRLGIVVYSPQKEQPQVYLRKNRMYADDFSIDLKEHYKRKEAYENRLRKMIGYIKDTKECRSKCIAAYFNDTIDDCGICDNCISSAQTPLLPDEHKKITTSILSHLRDNPLFLQDLLKHTAQFPPQKVKQVLDFLIAERKIVVNSDGQFQVK